MSVAVTTLKSGINVVTDTMPHLETASLGVWVNAGSRDDQELDQKRHADRSTPAGGRRPRSGGRCGAPRMDDDTPLGPRHRRLRP